MKTFIEQNKRLQMILGFLILFTVWWLVLLFSGFKNQDQNYLFAATYGVVALLGGIWGVQTARKWGGAKSVMGKAILCMSLGLLAAEFGQLVFSYYNVFAKIEVPYPSLADVGFFANIPLYSLGVWYLARASGIQFTLNKLSHKIQVFLLPVIMLALSYMAFLQQYEISWDNPLQLFLDFAYPLGQAVYISLALVTYSLAGKILGGIMKGRILFLLFAFVAQYAADYNFLFQNSRGTWVNGGYGDYLYFVAYVMMAVGLVKLDSVLNQIREKTE